MKLLFISVAIFIMSCHDNKSTKTGLEGQPLPEFNLLLTDSSTYEISNRNIDKRPIVFFYFSPYCPYCKKQTQQILEESDQIKDIQFYFLSNFSTPHLKKFYQQYQLNKYSNIIVGTDKDLAFAKYFMLKTVPYITIYGGDKNLKEVFRGVTKINKIKSSAL